MACAGVVAVNSKIQRSLVVIGFIVTVLAVAAAVHFAWVFADRQPTYPDSGATFAGDGCADAAVQISPALVTHPDGTAATILLHLTNLSDNSIVLAAGAGVITSNSTLVGSNTGATVTANANETLAYNIISYSHEPGSGWKSFDVAYRTAGKDWVRFTCRASELHPWEATA